MPLPFPIDLSHRVTSIYVFSTSLNVFLDKKLRKLFQVAGKVCKKVIYFLLLFFKCEGFASNFFIYMDYFFALTC